MPQRRPAETGGDSGLVEFALDHVLRASVVKTEDLVVDVETIHDKVEPMSKAEASLGVELEVRIKIVVAEWTGRAVSIADDILSVIGESHTNRYAAAIIGGADIPCVRRVAH